MISSKTELRVRYAETDQMGYVYYGNYAQYFEVARVEMLRELGFSYKALEERGVMLPVRDFSIRYLLPARYDDLLTIETTIPEAPSARIKFNYKIFNAQGELLNEASTTLVFTNKSTGRPCKAPDNMRAAFDRFFTA